MNYTLLDFLDFVKTIMPMVIIAVVVLVFGYAYNRVADAIIDMFITQPRKDRKKLRKRLDAISGAIKENPVPRDLVNPELIIDAQWVNCDYGYICDMDFTERDELLAAGYKIVITTAGCSKLHMFMVKEKDKTDPPQEA